MESTVIRVDLDDQRIRFYSHNNVADVTWLAHTSRPSGLLKIRWKLLISVLAVTTCYQL